MNDDAPTRDSMYFHCFSERKKDKYNKLKTEFDDGCISTEDVPKRRSVPRRVLNLIVKNFVANILD